MRLCSLLLGVGVWSGCGDVEVRTYQLAPYMEPGQGACVECAIALTMRARDLGPSGETRRFSPESFEKDGFRFRWGVEQHIEVEVEDYDSGGRQDDLGVRYTFQRVVETHAVEPGSRFEMHFPDAPPGNYLEDLLGRDGEDRFLLGHPHVGQRVSLVCDSPEVCDTLAARRLEEESFVLELSYPSTEGGPLALHSVRLLP